MNVITNPEAPVVAEKDTSFYIDAEGNRVEIPFDTSDGETSPEGTAFVAEDSADHAVTVH